MIASTVAEMRLPNDQVSHEVEFAPLHDLTSQPTRANSKQDKNGRPLRIGH
jgi:hypothetical protein